MADDAGAAAEPGMLKEDPAVEAAISGKLQDTPRTREALKRTGILLKELELKAFSDFYIPSDSLEKQRLRYNHHETRRQEKLSVVLKERAKVFVDMAKTQNMNQTNVKSYQSLHMLEQLLDKEAGRLEGDLKQNLRYHASVEAENIEQLEKEERSRKRAARRELRTELAKEQVEAKSRKLGAGSIAKSMHAAKIMEVHKSNAEAKAANFLTHVLEKEVRVREFKKSLEGRNFEKSEKWRAKCVRIQDNFELVQDEIKQRGAKIMNKFNKKVEQLHEKRRADQEKEEEEACRQHLKVVDVLDKKNRILRQNEFKRDKIREQMFHSESRIATLVNLKDQIVEKRRQRSLQQGAIKGRPANIKNVPVGPGQYEVDRDKVLHEVPVPLMPKISSQPTGLSMSHVSPPPGTYDVYLLPNGNRVETSVNSTVLFTKGKLGNFIEDEVRRYKRNPGPGTYELGQPGLNFEAGVYKLKPPIVRAANEDEGYKPPAWAADYAKTPGPAAYLTDPFLKKEEVQRHLKDLPDLGKAITVVR